MKGYIFLLLDYSPDSKHGELIAVTKFVEINITAVKKLYIKSPQVIPRVLVMPSGVILELRPAKTQVVTKFSIV